MSEPVPCPSCHSLLRLPPGATAVRCPNCKTVLEVEPADAPAAPPPAPAAPPLPFGRPRPATPVAPPRAAPPIPAAPPKRARLAPDQSPYDKPADDGEPDEDEKLRQMRRDLAKLEEQEIEQQEWLEELAGHCKHGRTAMHLLTWGVRAYALAVLLQLVTVAAAGFQIGEVVILALPACLAFAGIGSLLFVVGFGFAIAGPLQCRHIGVMGLVISILHALGAVLQPGNLAIMAGVQGIDNHKGLWSDFLIVQDMLGLATDLPLLADHPARFLQSYNWSIPGMIVAALEFTRLVLLAMLAQHYATSGKDPETGHRAFTTVNRVFWVVLLACSFRMAAAAIFDQMHPDDMLYVVGAAIHGAITFSCYFSLMIALLLFSRTMSDSIDLVDHRRFADKRERLEL